MKKKLLWLVTLVVCTIFVVSLSRTLYQTWRSSQNLENLTSQVEQLKARKEELKKVLAERKSEAYIEEEARDKLRLVKPDEKLVIIPETPTREEVKPEEKVNLSSLNPLLQWRYLFLGE